MACPRMVPGPVSFLIKRALYESFVLIYNLFKNFFGKELKTLKTSKGGKYIWRTLYYEIILLDMRPNSNCIRKFDQRKLVFKSGIIFCVNVCHLLQLIIYSLKILAQVGPTPSEIEQQIFGFFSRKGPKESL